MQKRPVIQPAPPEDSNQPELRSDGAEHEDVSVSIDAQPQHPMNVPSPRNHRGLSEREAQILDGLVKGHTSKVIARTCDVTEATVKVHMKSILRKIRVDKPARRRLFGRWRMAMPPAERMAAC